MIEASDIVFPSNYSADPQASLHSLTPLKEEEQEEMPATPEIEVVSYWNVRAILPLNYFSSPFLAEMHVLS